MNNNTNNTNQYIPQLPTQILFNTASQDTNIKEKEKEQSTYDDYKWYPTDGGF